MRRSPGSARPPIVLVQSALPDYRAAVIAQLREAWGNKLQLVSGDDHFEATVRTSPRIGEPLTRVVNRYLLGRRILWQRGALGPIVGAEVAILELNPRVLSVWAGLVARRMLRRRSVLWGHAWSRRGPSARTNVLRPLMWRLGSVVLVYTESERQQLLRHLPAEKVLAAPNALMRRHEIAAVGTAPQHLLYSGRLITSKKPQLAVSAFLWAAERGLPAGVQLLMAGAGPEEPALRARCAQHPAGARVRFLGHVPPAEMKRHYAASLASLSPGYVGLSIVQSLGHGVPMILARDEPHAPEIEAAIEGFNSVTVRSDDSVAMGGAILDLYEHRGHWVARRPLIARDCAERYSVERMASGFLQAARSAAAH